MPSLIKLTIDLCALLGFGIWPDDVKVILRDMLPKLMCFDK